MATDTDKGLDDIRREVIESRNLVIKTDNLLKNLHAELKVVGKRQEDFAKRQWISSAVTYLGFLALCIAAGIFISNARVGAVAADRDKLEKQVAELTANVDRLKQEAQVAAAAEQRAAEVYKQMTTLTGDERLKAIDALAKLDTAKVSPFAQRALQDRAALLRKEIGGGMFDRGIKAYHRNEWSNAIDELTRFLALQPSEDDANEATYALGYALFQQKKYDTALPHLQRYVAGSKGLKNHDYAMVMLTITYDQVGQKEKSIETAREGLNQHPNSEFGGQFRGRLKRAENEKAAGAPAGAAPAPPAPAPAAQPAAAAPNPLAPKTNP
ncbi:MAG: outer membrane protein assembly factor BamD [Myxococcaceae bacterium]|nr:outer membrane protein assembly factor BamD [Myxococcaceae bacterium]